MVAGGHGAGLDRRAVQIVFQHPDASLNPRHRIGTASWPGRCACTAAGAGRGGAMLEGCGCRPRTRPAIPHQLSGGEKQRVAIARAFAARPGLVICDEVTSPLDVSVQAEIVELLLALQARGGTAYLFITHDLNLLRQIAHRVAVLRHGALLEVSDVAALGGAGSHAYTRALLDAVPTPV